MNGKQAMKWAEVRPILQSPEGLSRHLSVSEDTLFRLSRTAARFYTRREIEKGRILNLPSGELKRIQSLIHKKVLLFAPYHASIHGYRKGRSQRSAAEPHQDKPMLLKGDIQKFFPSISPDAVLKAFRQLGISYQVSKLLVDLCTHEGQLPQGAPTSPLISNLIWSRPARRIRGFANQHGFDHTIFGDDVFISGASRAKKFKNLLKRIIREEGLSVSERKTQALPCTTRQVVLGIVVNKNLGVDKNIRRDLRQVIHNYVSKGISDPSRSNSRAAKASLAGKIAHVKYINRPQGQRLQREFKRIDWEEPATV